MTSIITFSTDGKADKTVTIPAIAFTIADTSANPRVDITYTLIPGEKYTELNYTLTPKNLKSDVVSARVWADVPGNITVAEATGLTGVLRVDVSKGNVLAWVKSEVKLADGTTMNGVPNDFALTFERKLSDKAPVISLTCSNPTPTSNTTGTIDYAISGTNLDQVESYEIFVVTEGDRAVSDIITTTAATGTIDLKNLNAGTTTNLWVKVCATTLSGVKTEPVQYPGEAQGWTGLSIDTNSDAVEAVFSIENSDVFSIDGRIIGSKLSADEIANLPSGIYISAGKKFIVK
ncbi:MAG: hypothetical protein NC097_04740 [Clostridium sp.]|nr:hypothetical protein [Clostridium sp.]